MTDTEAGAGILQPVGYIHVVRSPGRTLPQRNTDSADDLCRLLPTVHLPLDSSKCKQESFMENFSLILQQFSHTEKNMYFHSALTLPHLELNPYNGFLRTQLTLILGNLPSYIWEFAIFSGNMQNSLNISEFWVPLIKYLSLRHIKEEKL